MVVSDPKQNEQSSKHEGGSCNLDNPRQPKQLNLQERYIDNQDTYRSSLTTKVAKHPPKQHDRGSKASAEA
jgi:hypothetical protein